MKRVIRKIIVIDEEKCNGCGLCAAACPQYALSAKTEGEGFTVKLKLRLGGM